MRFRYPALVLRGAILICADAVVTGFAIGGPVAVGMLMLRTETAVGADVAERILIVVIDVGRAAHFLRVWAVLGRADVSVEGVAGLLGLSGAAGLGAELPVAGTVVVPAAIGVIGMPVATFGAVAVGVEGMGLFILPGFGGGGAVGVGTVTPVAGLIPAVEAFGVSVVTDGAGIAAGDAGRAGSTAVIMFGVVGNKIAIT